MSDFAPVFVGWNVWAVYQVQDLDFNPLMWGVDRDRQLRLWVEDSVRLGAPGAIVADPIDLKGGQVEILPGAPEGLTVEARKEQVSGPAMLVDGPAELRFVRFYNRGQASRLVWPHNNNYLLDRVYTPKPTAPATQGPPPTTIGTGIGEGVGQAAGEVAGEVAKGAFKAAPFIALGVTGFLLWRLRK